MARTKREEDQSSPHDALFYATFSIPRHAASALRSILPADVSARIRWDELRRMPDKFVDTKLTRRYSDLLFRVPIDGEEAFINILYEHKSEPETWTLLQVLEYMVRIWRAYLRERENGQRTRLPLILPVVLHHGRTGWTAARRFGEYFGAVHKALRPYQLDFAVLLDDVGAQTPDALMARPLTAEAKLVLLCMLLGRTPQRFFAELPKRASLVAEVWAQGEDGLVFSTLVVYMQMAAGIPQEETAMAFQNVLDLSPAEQIIFAKQVLEARAMQQGKLEGLQQGKLEGLHEGQQALLLKQLTQRFGPLPSEVQALVKAASLDELDAMALRVLTAKTLREVLGKSKRRPLTKRD